MIMPLLISIPREFTSCDINQYFHYKTCFYIIMLSAAEPLPPTNLILEFPTRGLGVWLSWEPGFALEGEEVTFTITYVELDSGNGNKLSTNMSAIFLTPSSHPGRTCQQYNFTVHSENRFSQSTTGITKESLLPTGISSLKVFVALTIYTYSELPLIWPLS